MAKGNMILTLVARADKWAQGLKNAGKQAVTFGSIVRGAMTAVTSAFLAVGGAILFFLPNFIKMGEEARKSERRLKNIADNTGLFDENLNAVTGRISEYAEQLSFLTGIDDELIRENEAVLLTFKNLAETADEAGGPFDRATKALLDLEAAGKNLKAVQLGKALQDPVNNLTALRKAGILLTDAQKEQIKTFQENNNILGAQDVILKAIEDQVGGTAEATASATERMQARFEDVVETLSDSLLPAVDVLADQFSAWLESPEGKKAIEDLQQRFEDFANWIASPEGGRQVEELISSIGLLAEWLIDSTTNLGKLFGKFKELSNWLNAPEQKWFREMFANELSGDQLSRVQRYLGIVPSGEGNPSAPGGRTTSGAPIINFNAPIDSVSAGREVARVLADYNRARGMG